MTFTARELHRALDAQRLHSPKGGTKYLGWHMFEAPSRPYTAGRVKEGSMHNARPRCYEIPSVYVALAIKHAIERKKPTVMQGATDRHRRSQLAARSARPAA